MVSRAQGRDMGGTWQTKIIFWTAICVSSAWLIVTVAIDLVGILQFSAEEFSPIGRRPLEILIVFGLTLQPLIVLLLIVRAIRHRGSGQPLRKIARAAYDRVPCRGVGARGARELRRDRPVVSLPRLAV